MGNDLRDRELDACVAEKIFKARLVKSEFGHGFILCDFPDRELGTEYIHLPPFSSDIKAAWKILEKYKVYLPTVWKLEKKNSGWGCSFQLPDRNVEGVGPTASFAICIAGLQIENE